MIKAYLYDQRSNTVITDVDLRNLDEILSPQGNLLWVDLYDCSTSELNFIGKVFDFHPLAIEDCLQVSPRAKLDDYDDYYFFVFHALRYNEESDQEISTQELDVFLGTNYLVTIHKTSLPAVRRVARHCDISTAFMERGADYLLYKMIDGIVDEYFPILDRIGVRIDELEDEIYVNPAKEVIDEALALKRTNLLLRKIVIPQMRIFSNMNGRYSFRVSEENEPYYLDLVDNLVRIADTTDTYRDLVNGALDAYYSIISNKTNDVMRVLTIISTVMMPLTFITGLFGMNVNIPNSKAPYMFTGILGGMGVLALLMMFYFKRKRWF